MESIQQIVSVQDVCGRHDFLGSRDSGEKLHAKIVELLNLQENKNMKLELDFNGVNRVSHSFADEVFGLMTSRFGVNFIQAHIDLRNASGHIKTMCNFAIKERLKKQKCGQSAD